MNFVSIPASNVSGAYATSGPGPFTMSGPLQSERITVYVPQGDVYIDNDIAYPANWTAGDVPLFQLVVGQGNIYIKNTVSRVDGVFIAQKVGNNGGSIYTCATSAAPLNPATTPNFYSLCNRKLTINGAFIANHVQFLRTRGTRQQATPNEASGSGNLAEVFNFSPALWMAQPVPETSASHYDSITSLPPVL